MSWQRRQRVGDVLTPALRRSLERALRQAQGRLPVRALIAMIEAHGFTPGQVAQLFNALPALLHRAAAPAVRRATVRSAGLEREVLRELLPIRLVLETVNPLAVQAARLQTARLVTRVTAQVRQAIQVITAVAIEQGLPPREAARLIRRVVGLTDRQSLAVVHFRARLLERGLGADRVRSLSLRYADRLLSQRALTIARTEIVDALTAGQQAAWRAATRTGQLPPTARQEWLVTPDDRLCPLCAQMEGRTAPLDGDFETPLGPRRGPTLHPNCRCAVAIQPASLNRRRAA